MKFSFPPVITLLCLIAQFILLATIPIPVAIHLVLGLLVLASSLALIIFSFLELNKFDTTYVPDGNPEKLVKSGPFRYSRNPIYLGMLGILISVSFFSQSLSTFIVPVVFYFIIEATWIKHEEEKLSEKFNKEWNEYKSSTRRWI
tara:strand:+ start:21 stop:455 length:435 start_codon:yes stop_codon:yes gene_type:complete